MSVSANTVAFPALARGAGFLSLWVVLIGFAPADLAAGVLAAAAATCTSLRLLPPQSGRMRLTGLLSLIPHFLWKSVVAGVDVARRALDPRLPLRPGFVACRVGFAPGQARNAFAAMTSLLPGTVPCADEEGRRLPLPDVGQPVLEELAEEERRLAQARRRRAMAESRRCRRLLVITVGWRARAPRGRTA
jgi:multicomponent Na+:H+ antiporter subunit E